MKTGLNSAAQRQAFDLGVPLITTLLLAALAAVPATAQTNTPYTSTGWVTGLLSPGLVCTNALGQVLVRANVHIAKVQSSDARLTGSRLIIVHGAYNADGTANLVGTCYQQVGTWDAAGTNFTPTGGLWDISYHGVMGTDNSLLLSLVGHGSGGAIEGMRFEETLTRTNASSPGDPAVPYLYTGTLKPAPVNTTEVVDNFDENQFTGSTWGKGTVSETDQQFKVVGSFGGVRTTSIFDSFVFGGDPAKGWVLPEGSTKEWRADLVSLSENATNTAILAVGSVPGYAFHKGRDFAYLFKWSSSYSSTMLWCERAAVRNTNVVLALALTRVGPNVVITARVLDKADPNTTLFQHTVMDKPGSDASLTQDQFQALTGMRLLDLVPDAAEAPLTAGFATLGLFQYTDGEQPVATAIFDNFELRTSEIPPVGIERAVRLSWPASATINYTVEGAPKVDGPWLPLQDTLPSYLNQMTIPASAAAQFIRLQQAP